MKYSELKEIFCKHEGQKPAPTKPLNAYITFTEDSFDKPYAKIACTYIISSNNKAFMSPMGGYSIYGTSVDSSDCNVRLERYMAAEHGGKNGWIIEDCGLFNIPEKSEWLHYLPPLGSGNVQSRCSQCSLTHDVETPFCPYCGAPMTDEAVKILTKRYFATVMS